MVCIGGVAQINNTCEELTLCFTHSFTFADANLDVKNVLKIIRYVVLKVLPIAYLGDPHAHFHMQSMMECYNVLRRPEDDDEL